MFIERLKAVRIVPAMNMDKWIALVRDRMEELGLTQEQLAERVGVSQGSVGHWVNKRRQPKIESMNRTFVEIGMPHYNVSLQLRIVGQVGEDRGSYDMDDTDDDLDLMQYIVCFRYPVLGWDELEGAEASVFEQTDYLAKGKAFWLTVENEAMSAASGRSVPQGMRMLVDPGVEVEPGRLVIARQPGKPAIFRELAEEGGQRYLKALNSNYPTLLCEDGCEFLGVVVRVHGSF
ncbi:MULTISPECIES: LexA family transcriptional regulator [unclassified Pseudomonas]|jgi:SOS-response transcriptional repressor LexA|uniref:LexA family transcriptional regulator n=1 Tax=unclassified Pseudomonas TaxID=196821 RepID=UPI000423D294|nr:MULTISPECIES: LexA family transcriptional regulator [unclassified Pseudomonas]ATP49459.1 Cro/Cl family transcriptional regulator [Pseudomonas putida]MDE4537781.1 helix-turn-helix domain-containing protein [Pseudomonas sp. ITEM 17296]SMF06329.1 SOS-response transcriptional repressor LexA (RecA-mediated autopeptidase) [Pseudomonas sp. LAIL14HWK12:I11]SMR72738.1 SOS-response transcriptional repressor LexA (RecA-mediated autopeptidase) [Pseudomonas sp. LAIL14HWK12:I10]SOD01623.1 SOS-response tr